MRFTPNPGERFDGACHRHNVVAEAKSVLDYLNFVIRYTEYLQPLLTLSDNSLYMVVDNVAGVFTALGLWHMQSEPVLSRRLVLAGDKLRDMGITMRCIRRRAGRGDARSENSILGRANNAVDLLAKSTTEGKPIYPTK